MSLYETDAYRQGYIDGATAVRQHLYQELVNRTAGDYAGLDNIPNDLAFKASLDQLEYNVRRATLTEAADAIRALTDEA